MMRSPLPDVVASEIEARRGRENIHNPALIVVIIATMGGGGDEQDHCMMHGYVDMDTVVEEDGHVGHGAILHSCVVGRGTLVGMNAVVMDGAVLGPDSIVAANSFVRAGFRGAPRQLLAGTPAAVRREVTEEEIAWMALNTREYHGLAARSHRGLRPVQPLAVAEADRPRLRGATEVVAIHAAARG